METNLNFRYFIKCKPPGRIQSSETLVSRMSSTPRIGVGIEVPSSSAKLWILKRSEILYEQRTSAEPKTKPFASEFGTYERKIVKYLKWVVWYLDVRTLSSENKILQKRTVRWDQNP